MSCSTLENVLKGCGNNQGGVVSAYLFDMDDIATITESTSTWNVTALTLLGHSPALALEFKLNTASYTDDEKIDLGPNGSTYWEKSVNFIFNRREAAKSKSIKILGEGQRYVGIVIGDANGLFWLFKNLQLSAVTGGSGKVNADGSNYDVTLVGQGEFSALEVSSGIAASLLIATS